LYALFSALFFSYLSLAHNVIPRCVWSKCCNIFLVTGVWLFLAGVQNRKWFLPLSAISFSLSIYTFNTSRIVAPLLVLVLAIAFWRKLWETKKQTITAVIVGFLIILPVLGFLVSPQAKLRFNEVNIFTDINIIKTANQEIANDNNAIWSKIIHNRRLLFSVDFMQHYFDNLSPSFLFIKGMEIRSFQLKKRDKCTYGIFPFLLLEYSSL